MTKEFMQQFTGDNPIRPVESVIFPIEGYYVATDGKRLLMVRNESCDFPLDYDVKKHGRSLNVMAVVNPQKAHPTHRLTLSDLRQHIESMETEDEIEYIEIPTTFEKCKCCDNGTITLSESVRFRGKYYEIEEEVDCPICHGFGKVPVDPEYDPNECSMEDDVEDWITYEERNTGHKVIGEYTICKIESLHIRATYLYDVVKLMECYKLDSIDFCIDENKAIFQLPDALYVFSAMYVDGFDDKWTIIETPITTNRL